MSKFIYLPFIVLLSSVLLTEQASEPNCAGIADFDNCLDNTEGFCPNDVACGCKDSKPYCKCPYYRGLWGDYWYMGHKCEQLWNTLDLILVTVLPAVALAFLVGVIIQCVYYCKNKSNKSDKRSRKQARQRELESQQNPVFVPEVADNSRYVSHPQLSQDNWTTDNIKMPKAQLKNQSFVQPGEVGSSSYIPHQPSGRPVPTADSYFGFQSHQHNQNSHFPDVDYEENGPTPVLPGRQFPKSGIPEFSRFDRFQSVAQPMANPNSGRPGRPYEIGRLQKYI
ncbi:uncharacterized protein LOC102458339 isoform X1 [Pelodiscus sinensis]|uniref:uncharacterized protein LOC102458339 isoform X1 n=1 Tax=Pelodiscus sinensis TaxID=13735 RepID=UPI000D7241AD|nr:uncharacterized protein LOC102458339 [Pelodiscus sinensis]|eukprot:XP_025036593.1 uncharacterized protein LOC102458339 [Pelodiscus sinensis]